MNLPPAPEPPRPPLIEVEQLLVRYGDRLAVDGLSFTAQGGQIFGLLGPNGAGKSTTVGCLSGLIRPTSGRVRLGGKDVVTGGAAARAGLGLVPQELALYGELSATANLRFFGKAYGLRGKTLEARVSEVLERVGLGDRDKEPVARFSGGMKRRLNFACGLVHEPTVLLLDEPTVGVDPQSRIKLMDLVREERERGTCVVYTTHYMEEAEALCDELAIVDEGRLLVEGPLEELRRKAGHGDVLRLGGEFPSGGEVDLAATLKARFADCEVLGQEPDALSLSMDNAGGRLAELFQVLEQSGAKIKSTQLTRASLESLFIALTGKELRE